MKRCVIVQTRLNECPPQLAARKGEGIECKRRRKQGGTRTQKAKKKVDIIALTKKRRSSFESLHDLSLCVSLCVVRVIYHLYRPVSKLATLKCSQVRAAVERRRTARRTAAARETESVYASANIRVTPRDWNSR